MISLDFIIRKANSSQVDKYTIIREYLQLVFLRYFYEVKREPRCFFKGGTAIRFLFNSFRFSEDLDFTCLGENEKIKDNLEKEILPRVESESGFKVLIKDEKSFGKIGVGFRLSFQPNELISQSLGIRLDFSFREKPLEPKVSAISVFDYPITPFPLIRHLSKKEILSEKIRAILTRKAPRDLFDLWFLLKQETPLIWDYVIKKMKYYPEIKYDVEILGKEIKKYKTADLKNDLNQFLPSNYRSFYAKIPEETSILLKEVLIKENLQ